MDAAADAMEVAVKRQCTEASQDSQQSGYSYDSDDDLVEDSGFAVEAEDSTTTAPAAPTRTTR